MTLPILAKKGLKQHRRVYSFYSFSFFLPKRLISATANLNRLDMSLSFLLLNFGRYIYDSIGYRKIERFNVGYSSSFA
jgi:hypothetical protein